MLKSLVSSSTYSICAAAFSYILMIFLARMHSEAAFSYYLYIVAWGLLIVQIIDVAAEQCLVHFSKIQSKNIVTLWRALSLFKLTALSIALIVLYLVNSTKYFEIPFECLFFSIPSFYLSPIFEYYAKNILYAKILFGEKLLFLILSIFIGYLGYEIYFIIILYFIISASSLFYQIFIFRDEYFFEKIHYLSAIFVYIISYYPVYLVLLSQLVYGNISRIIIESKLGPSAFAYVTLSLQIINTISIIQSQVDRHVRPIVIESINLNDWMNLKIIVRHYAFYYLIPVFFGCAFINFMSEQIIYFLFGSKWTEAANALRFASPLVFTIACMRFIDILVVPLRATKMNLFVNMAAAIFLFMLLWFNPRQDLESYVLLIVLSQALHVAFMAAYVYARTGYVMRQSVKSACSPRSRNLGRD